MSLKRGLTGTICFRLVSWESKTVLKGQPQYKGKTQGNCHKGYVLKSVCTFILCI